MGVGGGGILQKKEKGQGEAEVPFAEEEIRAGHTPSLLPPPPPGRHLAGLDSPPWHAMADRVTPVTKAEVCSRPTPRPRIPVNRNGFPGHFLSRQLLLAGGSGSLLPPCIQGDSAFSEYQGTQCKVT